MERDSFVFYRSFMEAMDCLDNDTLAETLRAIAKYALDGETPEVNGVVKALFLSFKPQIDANNRRYENGCKGGRSKNQTKTKTEPNGNQSETKTEPNRTEAEPNVNVNDNDNDNENVNENVNANENENVNANAPIGEKTSKKKPDLQGMIDSSDMSEPLKQSVTEWLTYKTQKKEKYTEMGFQKLLSQIVKNAMEYGDEEVIRIINYSIMQGYKGILFDKLSHPPATQREFRTKWEDL